MEGCYDGDSMWNVGHCSWQDSWTNSDLKMMMMIMIMIKKMINVSAAAAD